MLNDQGSELTEPNIFDYATSELSQDAFICWLLHWGRIEGSGNLRDASRDFVIALYNFYYNSDYPTSLLREIKKPERQYKKIDVYFEAIINDEEVSFIIEDKTWTSPHSNQLQIYSDAIITPATKNMKVMPHRRPLDA